MRDRRVIEARRYPGALAACIQAMMRGDESIDADAGAQVLAECVCAFHDGNVKIE